MKKILAAQGSSKKLLASRILPLRRRDRHNHSVDPGKISWHSDIRPDQITKCICIYFCENFFIFLFFYFPSYFLAPMCCMQIHSAWEMNPLLCWTSSGSYIKPSATWDIRSGEPLWLLYLSIPLAFCRNKYMCAYVCIYMKKYLYLHMHVYIHLLLYEFTSLF